MKNCSNYRSVLTKLSELTEKFNDFVSKHDKINSELQISRNCNNHLLQRITQLERNAVTNSQYQRRETIEINPVPESLEDEILEENGCKAFSLTDVNVTPEQLHLCHHLKKRNRVIVKFKCRKQRQNVLFNRKNLKDKSSDLSQLRFLGKLFISESMSHENHQLTYRCRQLKTAGKIHSTWFFNNSVNLKLTDNGPIYKIFYIVDIENILGIDNLEEYVNNSSF